MNELVCPCCGAGSPADALFCMNCGEPIQCRNCGANVLAKARACIKCGERIPERESSDTRFIGDSQVPPGYNRFTVRQRDESYSYDAEFLFSNEIAQQTSEFLSRMPAFGERAAPSRPIPQQSQPMSAVVDLDGHQPAVPQLAPAPDPSTAPDGDVLGSLANEANPEERALLHVFAERDGKLILQRSDLKAASQTDHVLRLVHLYLYGRQVLLRESSVARADVYEVTDYANLPRENVAAYISRDSSLVKSATGELSLNLTGLDHARECLREIMDPSIVGKYLPARDTKSVAKPKKSRKSSDGALDESQMAILVQHPETKALARDIPHNIIVDLPLLEQIIIALYGLHKAGWEEEVYYAPVTQYLYEVFDLKVLSESVRSRLRTAMSHHDKNIVHKDGEGYRITSSGIKHVETTFRLNTQVQPEQLGLPDSE